MSELSAIIGYMENLPETSGPASELSIDVEGDGVLVMGTPELIDGYIARLREVTNNEVADSAISKSDLGAIAGVAAGVASATAQHGRYVKISKHSMDLARAGKLVPAGGNYFRATTVGAGNKFTGQIVWKPIVGSPARLASIQMVAIQMALTTALADVQKAVAKVEDKVDDLLALSKAQMVGDIIGNHSYLKRLTKEVRNNGSLPNSDWEAVASLGPSLEQGLERIRSYAVTTVGRLDPAVSASKRAAQIDKVVADDRLGEALQLLIVAEQTLFYWQHLRLRRVMDTEPRHRESVHTSVQDILATQGQLDAELWSQLHSRLNGFERVKPLEIGRFWDVSALKSNTDRLQNALEDFRQARAGQIQDWDRYETPGIADAINEIGSIASNAWDRGSALTADGLRGLAGLIDSPKNERDKHADDAESDSVSAPSASQKTE
ncbi:hypothetical protein [Williamsia herbipolensis]|uniref:hypothetical protein n=1 Tax=Williamsia herbipolensis TaxID=1603258 RepID=UPI0005F885D3|nr:hypothetical protein [Williamsia herbipolensis]